MDDEKIYYSIGDVATKLNLAPSLIRFWEKEFPQLKPRKTNNGTRKYSNDDIALLRKIQRLVKEEGFTLEGARARLKTDKLKSKNDDVIGRLKEIRAFLQQLRKDLDR